MGSIIMWALTKHTCGSLQKSIMLLGLDFMPLDQILNVSLNGLKKRVATCHKTVIRAWMYEMMIVLKPSPNSISKKIIYLTISRTRVFLSRVHCIFCTRGRF